MTLLEPELGPRFSFRHPWIDVLFNDRGSNPSRRLDFLAIVVEAIRDDGFGAVFIADDLLRRQD